MSNRGIAPENGSVDLYDSHFDGLGANKYNTQKAHNVHRSEDWDILVVVVVGGVSKGSFRRPHISKILLFIYFLPPAKIYKKKENKQFISIHHLN